MDVLVLKLRAGQVNLMWLAPAAGSCGHGQLIANMILSAGLPCPKSLTTTGYLRLLLSNPLEFRMEYVQTDQLPLNRTEETDYQMHLNRWMQQMGQ
jgi:hypothetical protein